MKFYNKKISVRITEAQYSALCELGSLSDYRSVSELLRDLIVYHIKKNEDALG